MAEQDSSHATGVAPQTPKTAPTLTSIYVYETPIRIWHWINFFAFCALCVTGYLIGSPLPSVTGEASDHYLFGYIRFIHFASAYVFAIGFLGRIYWAFVGNYHAREIFSVPIFTPLYWKELFSMLKWYAFIREFPNRYIGHNPIARLSMFLGFVVMAFFMIITGFAMYGEGAMEGHITHTLFTSWVLPIFGNSHEIHTWHRFGMWFMICFTLLHIYAAVREEIMGRQSMISTMISGFRMFKE